MRRGITRENISIGENGIVDPGFELSKHLKRNQVDRINLKGVVLFQEPNVEGEC